MTQHPSFLPPPDGRGSLMAMPERGGYLRTQPDYHAGYANYPNMAVADEGFDPLKLLNTLVRYRWLLATLLAAALILTVLFTWQQTPFYRGVATLELNGGTSRVIQDLEMTSDVNDIRTFETARQKLASYDLARRVVFQLGLSDDQNFLAPTASFSLRNLLSRAFGALGVKSSIPEDPEAREALAIYTVRDNLSAELLRNTRLLAVSYSHADPELAAKVANQAARSFIDQAVDARSDTSKLTREFIQEQVISVKQKLELSEKALVDYAREAGITVTGTDATLIGQNISDVNASLAKAIDERLLAERQFTQAREGATAALPQVSESKSVQETKNKLIELQATYKEKSATLKPAFPEMRRLSAQIAELKSQLNQEIAAIGRGSKFSMNRPRKKNVDCAKCSRISRASSPNSSRKILNTPSSSARWTPTVLNMIR